MRHCIIWVQFNSSLEFLEALNLGPGVNTPLFEGSISVSDDELTVYFAGVTPELVFKIYKSTRNSTAEPFGARVLLDPPINSDGNAYGPALTPNEHTMFLLLGPTIHSLLARSTISMSPSVRTSAIRGVLQSTLRRSIARPVLQACPPSAPVARKSVGWAIAETVMATWISIARSAVRSLHHLAVNNENPRNSKLRGFFFVAAR